MQNLFIIGMHNRWPKEKERSSEIKWQRPRILDAIKFTTNFDIFMHTELEDCNASVEWKYARICGIGITPKNLDLNALESLPDQLLYTVGLHTVAYIYHWPIDPIDPIDPERFKNAETSPNRYLYIRHDATIWWGGDLLRISRPTDFWPYDRTISSRCISWFYAIQYVLYISL